MVYILDSNSKIIVDGILGFTNILETITYKMSMNLQQIGVIYLF